MKVSLKKNPKSKTAIHWTSCEPFVENKLAVLIHRVRYVGTYKIGPKWKPHIGLQAWCGNHMTGSDKFTFLSQPPDESIVCARCEDNAVKAGLLTSYQLSGKHVHTGGLIAISRCCNGEIKIHDESVQGIKENT